ncbi:Hypothetical predicted protein [Lecanosticta acicola]|uniref:Uncharacterized protein n=1 Tax=Lecanosticta acicola TaxID=111012 RepID=A0AAI9EEC6_9PEZI|nr:Hypothetical predicted protein [Lecanosticta acicola]
MSTLLDMTPAAYRQQLNNTTTSLKPETLTITLLICDAPTRRLLTILPVSKKKKTPAHPFLPETTTSSSSSTTSTIRSEINRLMQTWTSLPATGYAIHTPPLHVDVHEAAAAGGQCFFRVDITDRDADLNAEKSLKDALREVDGEMIGLEFRFVKTVGEVKWRGADAERMLVEEVLRKVFGEMEAGEGGGGGGGEGEEVEGGYI